MAALIAKHRAPYASDLKRTLGTTGSLLYRRGNFAGTLDDLFCEAMLAERDAEIALSPGFRWGASLLPGQHITFEDVTNACALSYPACYRIKMTGARLKEVLEDVADNIFNPDPYYQQGGDMVRTGGLGFTVDIAAGPGKRISDMHAAQKRQAARGEPRVRGRRLGEHQRGHRGTADLGGGRQVRHRPQDDRPEAERRREGRRRLTARRRATRNVQ